MALNKEYFESIDINIVRQKYYNANKVNSLLEDIRRQAEAMEEENRQLKEQLADMGLGKTEIGDTLLTAQAAARDIVAKAKIQAAKIVAEARQQREDILSGVVDQQEYAADCVRKAFDKIVHQQLESIELLNGMWQEFLCGLITEGPEGKGPGPVKPEPPAKPGSAEPQAPPVKPALKDRERIGELESMVNNIARELSEIMGSGRDEECRV